MGSFTELVVAFEFKPDVPAEVLAAFSKWKTADDVVIPALEQLGSEGPPMPEMLDGVTEKNFAELTLVQKSLLWEALFFPEGSAYFPGAPSTTLSLAGGTWRLTSRTHHHKMTVTGVRVQLEPLGEFVCPHASPEYPNFVGYMKYEYDRHPVLIWHRGAGFEFDDPNNRDED